MAAAPQKHPAGGTGPACSTRGTAGPAAAHPHLASRAEQQGQEPGRPPAASPGAGRGHPAGTPSGDTQHHAASPHPELLLLLHCGTGTGRGAASLQPPLPVPAAPLPPSIPWSFTSLPVPPAPNPPARPYRSGPAGQRRLQAAAPRNQSGRQEAPSPARPRSEPAEPGAGPPVRPRGRERGPAAPRGGLRWEGGSWVAGPGPGPCPSRVASRQGLNISRGGGSTARLGSLCSATLTIKSFLTR